MCVHRWTLTLSRPQDTSGSNLCLCTVELQTMRIHHREDETQDTLNKYKFKEDVYFLYSWLIICCMLNSAHRNTHLHHNIYRTPVASLYSRIMCHITNNYPFKWIFWSVPVTGLSSPVFFSAITILRRTAHFRRRLAVPNYDYASRSAHFTCFICDCWLCKCAHNARTTDSRVPRCAHILGEYKQKVRKPASGSLRFHCGPHPVKWCALLENCALVISACVRFVLWSKVCPSLTPKARHVASSTCGYCVRVMSLCAQSVIRMAGFRSAASGVCLFDRKMHWGLTDV